MSHALTTRSKRDGMAEKKLKFSRLKSAPSHGGACWYRQANAKSRGAGAAPISFSPSRLGQSKSPALLVKMRPPRGNVMVVAFGRDARKHEMDPCFARIQQMAGQIIRVGALLDDDEGTGARSSRRDESVSS